MGKLWSWRRDARSGGTSRKGRQGHTLLELSVAVVFMTFSMGAIITSFAGSMSMSRSNHQTNIALDAAQSVLEEIQSTEFSEIYARYNDNGADDPALGVPGADFDVVGLTAQRNDADGLVGRVDFPGDGFVLSEAFVDDDLGLPRDLNGDGDEVDDASTDYTILPVHVSVQWLGASGNQRIDLYTTIVQ